MLENPVELREESRRLLRGEAKVTFANGACSEARLLDISMSGLGLVLPINVTIAAELRVSFLMPDRSHGRINMELRGRVVTSILSGRFWGFRVGLMLLQMAQDQRAVLERYVLE